MLLAYRFHLRNINSARTTLITINPSRLNPSRSFFLHLKDMSSIDKYTGGESNESVCTVDNTDVSNYMTVTNPLIWLRFLCASEKKDLQEVMQYLEKLGVTESDLKVCEQPLTREIFKKVYLALKLVEKKQIYVFIDFLKAGDPRIRRHVQKTAERPANQGVIYLLPESDASETGWGIQQRRPDNRSEFIR